MNTGSFFEGEGRLSIVDPVNFREVASFAGFGTGPGNVAADGFSKVYVSSFAEGVMEFDTDANQVVRGAGNGVAIAANSAVAVDSKGRIYAIESGPCQGGKPGRAHVLDAALEEKGCDHARGVPQRRHHDTNPGGMTPRVLARHTIAGYVPRTPVHGAVHDATSRGSLRDRGVVVLVDPHRIPGRLSAQVNARGVVTCQSSGGLTRCPAVASWRGARLVTQLSQAPCLQDQSWGFDGQGIWVDKGCRGTFEAGDALASAGERVTCASPSSQRFECPARTQFGVRLIKQISTAPCRQNTTWGTTQRAIWVDRGCRAEFEVNRGPAAPPPLPGGSIQRLTCGSPSNSQATCKVNGYATSVRLVRELSVGRCRQNQSWGFTDSFIWANKGCRAEFEVALRSGSGGGAGSQLITCGVASGQYAACRGGGPIREVRLSRDLSGAGRCTPPQSWGHSTVEIWTRNGCRGEFQVIYQNGAGRSTPPGSVRVIACGLITGQQTQCKTGGYASSVRLVRDPSGGRCRPGQTWGYTETFIWTNGGCRGEFEVTYRQGNAPTPY